MDKLEQLLADLKERDERIDDLLARESLTEAEQVEHDKLVEDRGRLVKRIANERSRLAREKERLELEHATEEDKVREAEQAKKLRDLRIRQDRSQGTGRLTDADLPRVRGPGREGAIPAEVRRYNPVHFRGTRHGRSAEERAYRFGMWCLAELANQMPGRYRRSFPHAQEWVDRNLAAASTKDASGYSNLIPEEFGQDIVDLREVRGVVRRLFKVVPMAGDTRTDPRRQGGLTASWVGEGSAGSESNKKWDNVRLTAKDLMALARYTNQLNADSVINIGDDLASEIAYAFADAEDQAGFNGDASSTYGGIVGARTKVANFDGAGTASAGLVSGSGGTWATLTMADFHTVVGKLPQFADTPETAWVCHRAFYFTVMQKLEIASGGTEAREVIAGDRRPRPLFLGYPVEFSQVFPGATATGTVMVLLGNFMLAASLGDRQMDSVAFSEHATIGGENVFERNQIAVRGVERVDINVHDVGDASNPGPIVALKTQ